MRKIFLMVFFILIISIAPVYAQQNGIELHVAVDGSNVNPGTLEKPLADLEGAKEKVRELISSKGKNIPITVWFHGGVYPVDKTIIFDERDSGTEAGVVTYSSYNNEKVSFSGSQQLDSAAFKPVTDENILARLPVEGREKVGVLDLKNQGMSSIPEYIIPFYYKDSPPSYSWLYLNDIEQPISRWPNIGYATIEKVIDLGSQRSKGDASFRPAVFKYKGVRPDSWVNAKNALIEGYFRVDYANERKLLGKIDTENRTISIAQTTDYGVEEGKRWAVYNLIEELDSPGEWYIDRDKLLLYYYPPYSLKNTKIELSMMKDVMIKVNNTSNISFKGLTFEKTCGNVMEFTSCSNITVGGCTLNNIGRQGIVIKQGKNNNVIGCDFLYMGGTAIWLDGGDRQTLTPSNNKVVNNHFYKLGRQTKTYAGALEVLGVGNVVEHNLIHDAAHWAMRINDNDNKIRYNEIYNMCKESLDAGVIYFGRDFTSRGNEVSYNYIHDIATSAKGNGLFASEIYLDDMWCGTNVHHNILTNAGLGLLLGGGQYNRFENNIISNCQLSIAADNRGETWGRTSVLPGTANYNAILKVPYNQPPYSEKYPELAHIFDQFLGLPIGNVVKDNLLFKSGKPNINESVSKYGTIENNIEVSEDPGFVDIQNQDYSIKSDSEILKKISGLSDISMDKIGLVVDEYRKTIDKPKLEFRQIAPKNGSVKINGLGYIFAWEPAVYADKYHLYIAEDPEMKNIVYEGDTPNNYLEVKELESGLKNYYWKVEAINFSQQIESKNMSKGQPYLFTTTLNDVLSKDNLNLLIKNSEKTLDTIVEGSLPGQYKEGAKEAFKEAIDSAKQATAIKIGTQIQINEAEQDLNEALLELGSMLVKGVVGIENMIKDPLDWTAVKDSVKFVDNTLILSATDTNVPTAAYTKQPMKGYEMYCFDVKADLNKKWIGFGLKQNKPEGLIWKLGATGYLVVINSTNIELQRFIGGASEFITTVPNTFINDTEWHEMLIGAIDSGMGVELILKIDGKTVFKQLDTSHPITEPGYLVLCDCTGGKYMALKPVDKLPSGEDEVVSYVEPVEINADELLKDKALWKTPSGKLDFKEDTSLSYIDNLASNILAYNKIMPNNIIYNFRAKFNVGEKWQAIGIRAKSNVDKPWAEGSGGGYLIAIKSDSIELQRFNKGKSEFVGIVDNKYIKDGEWCDINVTAYDTIGGVQLAFKVNGEAVFEYLDPMPVAEPGYFALYDFSGLGFDVATSEK